MARIRTIKPEFPHSESMGKVSRDARLTFVQMWTLADDSGRLRGNSRMLASLLFPYDDDAPNLIEGWLQELERESCIVRYIVTGTSCVQICNWLTHQKIDKPSPSKLPPFDESSRIIANPRERSSGDQGSRTGIKDQGRDLPDRASAKPATVPEPEGFADIRKAYPKRAGSHRWQDALSAYRARLKEGVTPDEILAGVERYAAFVRADGKEGTEYVQQAATFIGKNRGYTEPWKPTVKVVALGPVERVLAAARKANGDERVVNDQGGGGVGNPVGDIRQPVPAGVRRITASTVGLSDWELEGFRDHERAAASE